MIPKKCIDFRKKNTKRKISAEVAYEVEARDGYCIFSFINSCKWSGSIEQIHHAFFWLFSNYWPNRNEPDQLVWVCTACHDYIHSRWWQEYRNYCMTYLKP